MIITEFKKTDDAEKMIELIRGKKIKFDVDTVIIDIDTGFAWLKTLIMEGSERDDIMGLLENYHCEHDLKEELRTWEYTELLELYDNDDDVINENHIAINGGEFYIDMIVNIEQLTNRY